MPIADPDVSAGARIAIVAESDAVADSLGMLLESHGYIVERLAFPTHVPLGFAQGFDCLLIGQFKPGNRGLALLAELRGQGIETHAALITNEVSEEDEQHTALRNVTVFEKPLIPNAILAFVAQATGRDPAGARAAPRHG